MTKMYRIVYDVEPSFVPGKGHISGKYHYEEITDYKEPTKEELQELVDSMYVLATEVLTSDHHRVSPELFSVFKFWKDTIDKSDITSEYIRWHQLPRKHKIPQNEKERQEAFRLRNGLI